MDSNKYPVKPSKKSDLSTFLSSARQLPQRISSATNSGGRLIFALDATASRQPSWDRACQLQGEMFLAASQLGGLELQLCYYRGFEEFHLTPWLRDSGELLRIMSAVQCLGGYTQLEKILNHSLREHSNHPVHAVIIIADAIEENVDTLCAKAGQLGLLKVPLFMFQEGEDAKVKNCFQQMAKLSRGAYASFGEHSAGQLAQLLAAVAAFAAGGQEALQRLDSSPARQLLQQIKRT